jgi:two-component sensor histidine kinase
MLLNGCDPYRLKTGGVSRDVMALACAEGRARLSFVLDLKRMETPFSATSAASQGSTLPAEVAVGGSNGVVRQTRKFWRPVPVWLLLSLLTFAALAPFLSFAAYSIHVSGERERQAEEARLVELAKDLAASVDRTLKGHIETAKVLTGSRSLLHGEIRSFWELAEDAARHTDGHFILTAHSNQQLVNTRRPVGSPLPTTAGVTSNQEVFASGEVQVGNLVTGAVARQPVYAVRLPVHIDDEVAYALAYSPRAEAIRDVVLQAYRPHGWLAAVLDGNGLIVARSHRHDDFFGKSATAEFFRSLTGHSGLLETIDLEGRAAITAHHASALSGWRTLVWAPRTLLEEPARAAQRTLALLFGFGITVSFLGAYIAGRLIQKPSAKLVEAAHDLARGRAVRFRPSLMSEANTVGEAIVEASQTIEARESALRESKANMQVVMRELSHRSKNLLALIQALVTQSARLSPDFDHFQRRLAERLAGLAHSHDLLVRQEWSSVPLDELLMSQLRPFADPLDDRLSIKGPRLLLKPQAAQSLGMAFHELATNAIKHGSLSAPSGRVNVFWERWADDQREDEVRLSWEEHGGPSVVAPASDGFGTVLIKKITPAGLGGTVSLHWLPDGFVWKLQVPVSQLVASPPDRGSAADQNW